MKKAMFSALMVIFIISSGCATKKYVNSRIDEALDSEISAVRSEIQSKEESLDNIQKDITNIRHEMETGQKSLTAEISALKEMTIIKQEELKKDMQAKERSIVQEAMSRAETTGNLKKGKLLYEVTISEESVPFAYNKSDISDDAKAAVDTFAEFLIKENKEVYIEIQGHTDDVGSEDYNINLGQKRAESVMRYLHTKHNIPLNHMSAFSYGESKPAAANDGKANRAKNRRVVLMVME